MMALEELVSLLENSDRLRIIKGGKEVFIGWLALLAMHDETYERLRTDTVKKFRAVPEICHRQWKEQNLMEPLEPDKAPEYAFKDLQMTLYYTIYL